MEVLTPSSIGPVEVRNRFIRSSTSESLADEDGFITPRYRALHVALARGSNQSGGLSVIRFGDSQGGTAKGSYGIQFPTDVTNCVAIGSIGETTGNGMAPGQITVRTDGHANANAANFADVVTYNSAGTPTDLPFNVAVFC